MDITYLGHSSFKLKGKKATVVTDPYDKKSTGFSLPSVSADIVTVSHGHADHNSINGVAGTARRPQPYVISAPGEYEVNGVGVFGWRSFHDEQQGKERGVNTMYAILIDGVRVVHLGDLGHMLDDTDVENLGAVDVLLIPVGGVYSLDPEQAVKVITQLQPSIVVPMHYKTAQHSEAFAGMQEVPAFLKAIGAENTESKDKLKVDEGLLPEEMEIVLLQS